MLTVLVALIVVAQFWRIKLMADNNSALALVTTAINDAVAALKDLATKAAGGEDVSGPLTTLAANLESAVAAAGEPTTGPTS